MNHFTAFTIPDSFHPAPGALGDRSILITGAANGIGRALALACARLGAKTILLDIDKKRLESLYDQIESENLAPATLVPLDLFKCDGDSFDELAGHLQTEFGRLDGLVHCAAELGALCPLENYDQGNWHKVMQTNLNAAYLLTRACLPLLRHSGNASILFTTADVARQGKAYWGAYSIAGYAIEGMAQIWAKELSGDDSIRVNTIDPGAVNTALRSSAYPGENRAALPAPEDVVTTYLYLLIEASADQTGQQFSVKQI